MPADPSDHPELHIFGTLPDAFDRATRCWGWPDYRGKQVREWVFQKLVTDPAQMTNLSKVDRERLADSVSFFTGQTTAHQSSSDGTRKLLLGWPGGANAETVMIPDADRRTACISSQTGCPVGCKFCASGIGGVKGNLTSGQIVEQVFALNQMLQGQGATGEGQDQAAVTRPSDVGPGPSAINHIVFMGMGEPLANYANVLGAVRILHHPQCFNISARKITISTVGVPTKIRQLAEEELPLNLAISLHAPNEALRRELIPWAEHFAMDDILDSARYYFDRTGREVTLEYILLHGVNDRPQHARQLVHVCRTLRANVNLIRYNEVESLPYKRPKSDDVMEFQQILRRGGVNAHVRKSRGRDIDAACGQLRRREQQSKGTLMNLGSAMLLFLALTLSQCIGCATLLRGDTQKVKVQTDPAGATINLDGKEYTAPVELSLKRKDPHTIIVSAPGHQTIAFDLEAQWDGASLGSMALPGGSIWFGVDTVSGADRSFYRLATIKLDKSNSPGTQPVTMYSHKGKLMTKAERDKAVQEEIEFRNRRTD
jgi:23S rRNA (adenine2503-C2)-methyltransferase